MSDPKYAGIGLAEVRLMEEAAELIHAVSKAVRFGWQDYHPEHPGRNNETLILGELNDLVTVWNEIAEKKHLPYLHLISEDR